MNKRNEYVLLWAIYIVEIECIQRFYHMCTEHLSFSLRKCASMRLVDGETAAADQLHAHFRDKNKMVFSCFFFLFFFVKEKLSYSQLITILFGRPNCIHTCICGMQSTRSHVHFSVTMNSRRHRPIYKLYVEREKKKWNAVVASLFLDYYRVWESDENRHTECIEIPLCMQYESVARPFFVDCCSFICCCCCCWAVLPTCLRKMKKEEKRNICNNMATNIYCARSADEYQTLNVN